MSVFRFIIGLFCIGLLPHPGYGQVAIPDSQAVYGPWECVDSAGIHGIVLSASVLLRSSGGEPKIAWKDEGIWVSQRLQGGRTQGGSFVSNRGDGTSMTSFDGKRLIMHFTNSRLPNLSPFDMDITYDPGAGRWTGFWSFCDSAGGAVLERPHPRTGAPANVLAGDWEGGPSLGFGSGRVMVRESMDGKLVAWLSSSVFSRVGDLTGAVWDETNETLGRQVFVKSSSANKVTFEISDGVWFDGTVSGDGKEIRGVWNNEGPGIAPTNGKRPPVGAVYRRKD